MIVTLKEGHGVTVAIKPATFLGGHHFHLKEQFLDQVRLFSFNIK